MKGLPKATDVSSGLTFLCFQFFFHLLSTAVEPVSDFRRKMLNFPLPTLFSHHSRCGPLVAAQTQTTQM